jgi:hypothetical protein
MSVPALGLVLVTEVDKRQILGYNNNVTRVLKSYSCSLCAMWFYILFSSRRIGVQAY